MTRRRSFLLRWLVVYLFLLLLAKSPFVFDRGLDPASLWDLLLAGTLVTYRFMVFAVIPAIFSYRFLSLVFRR